MQLEAIGVWLSLLFTAMVFSALAGDHGVARLAKHILVGAGLGYAGVIAWRHVLLPALVVPLIKEPFADPWLWVPLVLVLLLLGAGIERVLAQGTPAAEWGGWRTPLRFLGGLSVALMLGAGMAVTLAAAVQGTLLPQVLAAARGGIVAAAPPPVFASGLLVFVVTIGVLLHLKINPARDLTAGPRWLRRFLLVFIEIGKRALWVAAGAVFARLLMARFSLLIARFEFVRVQLQTTELWRWAENAWQRLL